MGRGWHEAMADPLIHRLTIALGVYGPPSVGRYNYPEPNYTKNAAGKYIETPNKFAPQRYSLIKNDVIILYPTLSAGFEIHKRFQIGVSLQLVVSKFKFRESLYSGLTQPMTQGQEEPIFDSIVEVDLEGNFIQHGLLSFTGIVGAMFQPLDNLSIGASLRPPINVSASGTLAIEPGEVARKLNTRVIDQNGADCDVAAPLPDVGQVLDATEVD